MNNNKFEISVRQMRNFNFLFLTCHLSNRDAQPVSRKLLRLKFICCYVPKPTTIRIEIVVRNLNIRWGKIHLIYG